MKNSAIYVDPRVYVTQSLGKTQKFRINGLISVIISRKILPGSEDVSVDYTKRSKLTKRNIFPRRGGVDSLPILFVSRTLPLEQRKTR